MVQTRVTAKDTSSPAAKKKGGRKKTATADLTALQSKKAAIEDEFSKAQKTRDAYKGYLARGRDILADIVKQRRLKEKSDPGWKCPEGIDTELLAKAFQGTPNKYSAMALELYLAQKCVVEGHGKSTAEGIHGAWADYWDRL